LFVSIALWRAGTRFFRDFFCPKLNGWFTYFILGEVTEAMLLEPAAQSVNYGRQFLSFANT